MQVGHCADGCLFELRADPLEAHDRAPSEPARLARMLAALEAAEASA
jgi:hypothetical protein